MKRLEKICVPLGGGVVNFTLNPELTEMVFNVLRFWMVFLLIFLVDLWPIGVLRILTIRNYERKNKTYLVRDICRRFFYISVSLYAILWPVVSDYAVSKRKILFNFFQKNLPHQLCIIVYSAKWYDFKIQRFFTKHAHLFNDGSPIIKMLFLL